MKKISLPKNLPFPELIEKAKTFLNKTFQDKNEKLLEELEAQEVKNPNDFRLKQKLAEAYYKTSRFEDAAQTYLEIATHHEKEGFHLKAIEAYKNVLKIKPDSVDINLKLAKLYLKVDMLTKAANQYRIAISHYAKKSDHKKGVELAQELVKIDPSEENRAKLAEIYHTSGMKEEAIQEYEILAKDARAQKNYDKLLHYYEMILPHRPQNTNIIRDICILYLRKKEAERALNIMEQYNVNQAGEFQDLVEKSKLMLEALRKQRKLGN